MSAHTSRSIAKILERVGTSNLAGLSIQAQRLVELERQIRACLPQELAEHCQVAGIRDGCLNLFADSPAWAARLRFQEPQIIQAWRQRGGGELRKIQVRVLPQAQPPRGPAKRKLTLTEANVQLLEQTARGIPDARLAQALRRLARRGAKNAD